MSWHVEGPAEAADRSRIDDVLADLGAQLEAAEAAELAAEVEDRTRREAALISLLDRLRASFGRRLTVETAQGAIPGELSDAGPDWLLLRHADGTSAVVPLASVLALAGLGAGAVTPASAGPIAGRIDLRHVMRGLVRDRSAVRVAVRDGRSYSGVLQRCGADFVEIGEAPGVGDSARARWLVPLSAIVVVHVD